MCIWKNVSTFMTSPPLAYLLFLKICPMHFYIWQDQPIRVTQANYIGRDIIMCSTSCSPIYICLHK